jgi:hypothetical protein
MSRNQMIAIAAVVIGDELADHLDDDPSLVVH